MKSKLFKIDFNDLKNGLITTILFALFSGLYKLIENGGDIFNINELIIVLKYSVASGIAYILKRLLSNEDGVFFKKDGKINFKEEDNE